MNDFTKEELEEIVDMANDIDKGSQAHGLTMHFKLRDKAQSMIDNYCEHEQCGDGAGLEQICFKCNKSSNDGWN